MRKPKVNKGVQIIYGKLSYRRKFIRSLWMIPGTISAVLLVWRINYDTVTKIIWSILLIIIHIIELIYNYLKWKKDESTQNS